MSHSFLTTSNIERVLSTCSTNSSGSETIQIRTIEICTFKIETIKIETIDIGTFEFWTTKVKTINIEQLKLVLTTFGQLGLG